MFNFRDVEHNLCIALDSRMSAILSEGEDCGANAVICYGYVDKQAGLTFEVLCLISYIDGDYTIVNENKTVSMKVRGEAYKNTEVFPIKNAAIMKRFEQRIQMIEDNYYSHDSTEETRKLTCVDKYRHPFYPDDIQAILTAEGLKPERIWVGLTQYVGNDNGAEVVEGELLNEPFDSRFNVSKGDEVFVLVINGNEGEACFVIPKK